MKLTVKIIPIKSVRPLAIMNQSDAEELGVFEGDRVRLIAGRRYLTATVQIALGFIERGNIGICLKSAEDLGIEEGSEVDVVPIPSQHLLSTSERSSTVISSQGTRYTR